MSNVFSLNDRRKSSSNYVMPPSSDTQLILINSLIDSGYVIVRKISLEFDEFARLWKLIIPASKLVEVDVVFWYHGDTPKMYKTIIGGVEAKHTDAKEVNLGE